MKAKTEPVQPSARISFSMAPRLGSSATRPWLPLLLGLLLASALPAPAQNSPAAAPAQSAAPAKPAPPSLVFAVAVTDRAGAPISGLTQADFSATDNGAAAPILGFRAIAPAQAPSYEQVIFVLDGINLNFRELAQARDGLVRYLRSYPQLPLQTQVVAVGDTSLQSIGTPGRDGAQLATALAASNAALRIINHSAGIEGAGEQIGLSLRSLNGIVRGLSREPGHKLLVWISGGWPLLNLPIVSLSNHNQNAQFREFVELLNSMRAAGITLSSVDPRGALSGLSYQALDYRSFLKPVRRAADMQIPDLSTQVLATESGGLVINASNDIAAELAKAVNPYLGYYTVELPAAPTTEQPAFHSLAVHVHGDAAAVHTDSGYYTTATEP